MSGQIYELTAEGLKPMIEKFTELKRGDVLLWGGNMGYPAEELVIIERIKGYEDRIMYKCINLKRYEEEEYLPFVHTIEAYSVKDPKDPKLWHRQHHFITGKTIDESEILRLIDEVPKAKAREELKELNRIAAIKAAGQLTKSEKINLGTAEISKRIKAELKKRFPKCTFSVVKDSYSGGSSITVSLMRADFKVFREYSELSEEVKHKYVTQNNYSLTDLEKMTKDRYYQLNRYTCLKAYDPETWNNGAFLTEKAHNMLKEVCQIADYYNYDDSDSQTDYYSVNFSFSIHIGKWDKPFQEVV